MGKKRLELQFKVAADIRFREGADKHALKREGKLTDSALIFGYSTYYNLLDFSDNFCRWMRENGIHFAFVKDITVEAWNAFLEAKATLIGPVTLKNYASRVRTWEKIINAAFGARLAWSEGLLVPHRLSAEETELQRVQQMQREDFQLIQAYIRENKIRSQGAIAIELSARFGLRVEGTARIKARNVHLDEKGYWGFGTIDITEKGNRRRIIDIKNASDRKYIAGLITGKLPEEHLVPIKKDSVNKFLYRVMIKIGLKEKYPETSIHSIRKMYAQETWDNCRKQGYTWEQALRYVNRQLGHGEERNKQLLGVYVKEMW